MNKQPILALLIAVFPCVAALSQEPSAEDRLREKGYVYVSPAEATAKGVQPGWHLPPGAVGDDLRNKIKAQQNDADSKRKQADANAQTNADTRQQAVSRNAQQSATMRQFRRNGELALLAKPTDTSNGFKFDAAMSNADQIATGLGKLSATERETLERWVGSYVTAVIIASYKKPYSGISAKHWMKRRLDGGQIILDDNSVWTVHQLDRIESALWSASDEIIVVESDEPSWPYLLIDGRSVARSRLLTNE